MSDQTLAAFVNDMTIFDIRMSLDDMVDPLMTSDQRARYQKLRSLERLYERATAAGEVFSWDKAREKGWVCEHDYSIFEELAGLDPLGFYSDDVRKFILAARKKRDEGLLHK